MLTSMQKINFVIHVFLKILQRNSKLFILGNLACLPGHTHLKRQYHFEETLDNYQQVKINFILYVFIEMWQRYCTLIVLGTLGIPGCAHPKWYYQFVENFRIYLQARNQFHTPCFSGDSVKIFKLILGTLVMPGYTQPKW